MPDLLDCALLSLDVYSDGTEVVDREARRRGWRREAFLRDDASGFAGAAYAGPDDALIVAHRGTELFDSGDWRALSAIGFGRVPERQARAARSFLQSLRGRRTGGIVLTGHSLGGFLAKWLALECDLRVVAFNAPSVRSLLAPPQIVRRPGGVHPEPANRILPRIHNVHATGDPVTRPGGWVRRVLGEPLGRITVVETGMRAGESAAARFRAPESLRTHGMHHLVRAIRRRGPALRAA